MNTPSRIVNMILRGRAVAEKSKQKKGTAKGAKK